MLQGLLIYLAFGVAWAGVVAWRATDEKKQAEMRAGVDKLRREALWSEGGMPMPSADSLVKAVTWMIVVDAVLFWPISMLIHARKAWKQGSEK